MAVGASWGLQHLYRGRRVGRRGMSEGGGETSEGGGGTSEGGGGTSDRGRVMKEGEG